MQVLLTNWGLTVRWGFNNEEYLRDLRKLNDGFSSHHPDYDKMCLRSDELNKRCLEALSQADMVCNRNHRPWTKEDVADYDKAIAEFVDAYEALYDLCVNEYPRDAHVYGYSYCV